MDQHSARLSPLPRSRHVQSVILVAFILPLLSALFYLNLFGPFGGLDDDYWLRNEFYPLLALIHDLGSIGMRVTLFCAVLACILLAHQGIERFGRPGDAPFHRLTLVAMCLPVTTVLLASFPPLLPDGVAIPLLVGSLLLISLLLIGWGAVRREAFTRALPHLLPWLGIHLGALTVFLGNLLYNTGLRDTPRFNVGIVLVSLLSMPFSFAAVMVWLRLGTRVHSILLTLVTVEALGMALVQLMMLVRLIVLNSLGLGATWTSELIGALTVSVLFTALALLGLLTLRPWSRGKAAPAELAEDWVVEPLS